MERDINSEKRILILSNGCFSDTDSNGRTLAKLFQNYNNANLAQFFVYGNPDFTVCDRYYKVTDRDALKSLLKWKETGGLVESLIKLSSEAVTSTNASSKKVKKTPLSMLLREFAWLVGRWNGRGLKQWIDNFNPEAVFVSLGDNIFLSRLAIQVAKKYSIPVYAYSTENYCFKNYNYLTKRPSLLYKIFYLWMNKAFKKLEKYVKLGIFNTPMLTEAYAGKYNYPCTCIFSPSDIDFVKNIEITHSPTVAYLGNLGVGRHKALVELANVLGEVMPGVKLDVYGKLPESIEAAKLITGCDNICYKGFVSYGDVVRHIHESTLIVHAELDDGFYSKDLKFAFSTKIADSVCSGTPLLIYARRDLAETDFLIRNQCAFVADSKDELRQELVKALIDKEAREVVVQNAKEVRNSYFTYANGLKDLIRINNDKHRMKVLQVNCVYKKGSTGKIIYDTHNGLKQRGIQSVVCYGRGQKINESNVYKTSSEIFAKFNALKSRLTGLQYNGSFFATNKLINVIKNEKPDVVHLHCINGYFVNIYRLIDFLKKNNIKTVLTLHAEFMYTGSCGHSLECTKWMESTGCGKCPILLEATHSYFFDRTHTAWKKMKCAFEGFDNLIVTSVSPWLMQRAKQSTILSDMKHYTVLNGIDTIEVFHPCDFEHLKKKHRIIDEKILLHVTANFTSEFKGGKYIIEIAKRFKDKNIKIIVIGNQEKSFDLPHNIIDVGRINDQKELAAYYSMADLTVITSKRETFSMVCAESLACGTPVVGFKAGAPEQIALPQYSEFVEYGDIENIDRVISRWIDKKNVLTNSISNRGMEYYSKEKMCKEYIKLYDSFYTNKK